MLPSLRRSLPPALIQRATTSPRHQCDYLSSVDPACQIVSTATSSNKATGTSIASSTSTATATSTPLPSTWSRTVTCSYDGLQRLTGATENPETTFAYSYDPAGNRTGVSVNGTATASYSYDAADQAVGWSYDAAGNLLSDGATSYSYDALNRLTGASATGQDNGHAPRVVGECREAGAGYPTAPRRRCTVPCW